MAKAYVEIESLFGLGKQLAACPDGTTCDILASDLEAGNFDRAHFVYPDGIEGDVVYTGPVVPGYVSLFEAGEDQD